MDVAFVSLPAYPVVAPEADGVFGGTETRAVTLAQGLAKRDSHHVTFLARHEKLAKPVEIESVDWQPWRDPWTECNARLGKLLARSAHFPYVQVRKWSPTLLYDLPLAVIRRLFVRPDQAPFQKDRTLLGCGADCFCSFGVHSATAKVISNSHRRQKPALVFLGTDADVDPRYASGEPFRNAYGERSTTCRWILQHADGIVAQNRVQQQRLKDVYERDSFLLPNPIDLEAWQSRLSASSNLDVPFGNYVLWVGRADDFHKRVPQALEIARRTPGINYVFIMNPQMPEVERDVRERCPPNVHLVDQARFDQMPGFFENASLLLNTSATEHEGLPNTFLQAAASRVPIVSMEVDAGFLTEAKAGLLGSGSIEQTISAMRSLLHSPESYREFADSGYEYVARQHGLESIIDQLESILSAVIASSR